MMTEIVAVILSICIAKYVNAKKNLKNVQDLTGLGMETVMMKIMWQRVILTEMIVAQMYNTNIAINVHAKKLKTMDNKHVMNKESRWISECFILNFKPLETVVANNL